MANSRYLSELSLINIINDPKLNLKSLEKLVRRKVKVYASGHKLFRTKREALEKIQCDVLGQFNQLREFCVKTINNDHGSTAILKLERPPIYKNSTFQRICILYDAQKRGVIEGCRKLIDLDACFLKSPFKGQLMSTVGRDGNNQIYPLSFVVVESECRDSWSWFLTLFIESIGMPDEMGWSFISDKQKGLVESFEKLMPNMEQRFCVRHIYANFKKVFNDPALKDMMGAATTSYVEERFKEHVERIRKTNSEAYLWLCKIPPKLWCKHKVTPAPKCDMFSNNLCESYNNFIKDVRINQF